MNPVTEHSLLQRDQGDGIVGTLFTVYGIALLIGALLLRFAGLDSGLPMNFDRAVFWAANSITCTGFQALPNGLPEFSWAGLITVYGLVLIGAMLSMIIGSILVCRYANLPHSPRRVIAAACVLMITATLLGAGLLMSQERSFFEAIFEATNVITNAGMSLTSPRDIGEWQVQLVIIPFAAIGGLGLPVLIELFDNIVLHRPISAYSRHVLWLSTAAWLAAFAILVMANTHLSWRQNILSSWTYAINSRSLGQEIPVSFGRVSWWLLSLFMLIGTAPAGTGGGVRLTSLSIAARQIRKVWAGEKPSAIFPLTAAWVVLFFGLGAILFLLLLSAEPGISSDRLALIASGAIGNTGISQDPLSMSSRGLTLLSTAMLAGHLLPLRFCAWLVEPVD